MAERRSAKRFSRDEQRKTLWNKWVAYIADIIINDAALFSKMDGHDVEIFNHSAALMAVYRDTAAIYDANREVITTPSLRDILEGVYNILNSRLKQEEEPASANPIEEEKRSLCLNALRKILPSAGSAAITGEASAAGKAPAEGTSAKPLYDIYREGLKLCVSVLNDLPNRPVTQNYIDMMQSEWEVMSALIRIQVNALEAALPKTGAADAPEVEVAASMREAIVVNDMLTRLREGYQYFGRAVTALNDILRGDCAVVFNEKTRDEFDAEINKILEREDFRLVLNAEVDSLADKVTLRFAREAYRFQRLYSEESHLAEDVSDLFVSTFANLPKPDKLSDEAETHRAILTGVAETIEIKIESLKESISYFIESGKQLIRNFAGERKEISEEDKRRLYDAAPGIWLEEMKSFESMPVFFQRMENEEVFAKYKNHHEKRINEYIEKVEKAMFSFKRETLLYEICTYEEILTHSVSRLRESELDLVRESVTLLDETFAALEVLLRKNNIHVICPAPHDVFNGREHEVLVAETHDGFNKGEIIKSINSGYKQKDTVILRANVVAAR